MEYQKQYYKEDGDTPYLMSKDFIRLVRTRKFFLLPLFALRKDGRIMLGYIFISAVRDKRLEVAAESVVGESLFEFFDHSRRLRMRFYFQLVKFHKFNRVEQSVVDALTFERDFAVADKVHERTSFENGFALTLFVGRVVRAFHKFFKPFFFQRGNGYDGNADFLFKACRVDFIALFFDLVHHVERDDHRHVDFHNLSCQIQVAFKVCRVDDIDDAVRLFVKNEVSGNDFFGSVRRQRINARKVDDRHGFGALFVRSFALIDRYARPVADVRGRTRQGVE